MISPEEWQYIYQNPLDALTDREIIQNLCREFSVNPSRQSGQNFLIEPRFTQVMVEAADIKKDDNILEVGPGFGILTSALVKQAGKVVAIEKDKNILQALKKIARPYKNLDLVEGDVLEIEDIYSVIAREAKSRSWRSRRDCPPKADLPRARLRSARNDGVSYKLVANLPYGITSAVLRRFTSKEPKPKLIIVMVQKEVAERVCAPKGEMSLLSVSVQLYGQPEIIQMVPREAFWPKPEVNSAILKIAINSESDLKAKTNGVTEKKFFQLARIGFSSRRKQLQNNLAAGLHLPNQEVKDILIKTGFDSQIRAQDLSVDDWLKLARNI